MSYSEFDKSVSNGSIVELYTFSFNQSVYRYASTEDDYEHGGFVFKNSQIKRSRVKQSQNMQKDGLNITVPISFELSKILINPTLDDVISLLVQRGDRNDPSGEFITYWIGRVIGCTVNGESVDISCESVFTSIKRPGLRARFEINCRHSIYSVGCGASQSANAVPATVTAVNGSVIEFTSTIENPSGFFTGGILKAIDGSIRFIAKHEGDELTVFQPINQLIPNADITLYPGCDKTTATCKNRFDNLDNFGGFPYIPIVNPFSPISTW